MGIWEQLTSLYYVLWATFFIFLLLYSSSIWPMSTDKMSGVKLGVSRTETSSQQTQWNYSIIRFYLVHKKTERFF